MLLLVILLYNPVSELVSRNVTGGSSLCGSDIQHRQVFQWKGNMHLWVPGWLWIRGNLKTLTQFFLVILGKSFMSWTVWDEEFYRWVGSKSGQQERSLWSFYWWKKQADLCRLLCFTGENKGLKKKFKTPQASASVLLDEIKTALVMLTASCSISNIFLSWSKIVYVYNFSLGVMRLALGTSWIFPTQRYHFEFSFFACCLALIH